MSKERLRRYGIDSLTCGEMNENYWKILKQGDKAGAPDALDR
jgi:hypothetical protein